MIATSFAKAILNLSPIPLLGPQRSGVAKDSSVSPEEFLLYEGNLNEQYQIKNNP
jgi:hypothetical protein